MCACAVPFEGGAAAPRSEMGQVGGQGQAGGGGGCGLFASEF